MKKYPEKLFYIGDTSLLSRKKVSVVGTRRPSRYAKEMTFRIAKELAKRGVVVVSGAAMGTDAVAHKGAGAENTIAVMGNSLDIRYPAVNGKMIEEIERKGLVLSLYEKNFRATKWSFVVRNEIVVALGEILIVPQADLKSGSMRSVEFALKMGKKIFVLPHRLGESEGTNRLLKEGLAEAVYDPDEFIDMIAGEKREEEKKDPFLLYLLGNPSYEEAVAKYGSRIFEAELEGIIEVVNGRIRVV